MQDLSATFGTGVVGMPDMDPFDFNLHAQNDLCEGMNAKINEVWQLLSQGIPDRPVRLLLYCRHGCDESAGFAAAVLATGIMFENTSFRNALKEVRAQTQPY